MAWAIAIGFVIVAFYEAIQSQNGSIISAIAAIPDFLPGSDSAPATSGALNIPDVANVANGVDMNAISKFVLGIWKTEGMGPNDRAVRNNNPGNLKFAGQAGATEATDGSGFAVFDTWQNGFAAAVRQVQLDATRNPNWTILQEMRKWLGMDPNAGVNVTDQGNALTKAQTVAASVGAKTTDTLASVLGV